MVRHPLYAHPAFPFTECGGILFETLYNFVQSLLGPRLTRKYFWYFGTIFTIILVSNYMGLLPGWEPSPIMGCRCSAARMRT